MRLVFAVEPDGHHTPVQIVVVVGTTRTTYPTDQSKNKVLRDTE
jgi:hypothetical protein